MRCSLKLLTMMSALGSGAVASGQDIPATTATPTTSQAPAAAPAVSLAIPAFTGPLTANPTPLSVDAGPFGKIYVTGALSGVGVFQDHAVAGDRGSRADVSNAQVIAQTTTGILQFYVQGGLYSLPSLGTPYLRSSKANDNLFGVIPQAFVRIVPTSEITILVGKLPSLFGAEYSFTFENMNVTRGLLWNQENSVSRGAQATYAKGPLSLTVSLNDGYYSGKYNWVTGAAAYTINASNTVAVVAGGNLGHTAKSSFATPVAQNNGEMVNIIYTFKSGPLTVSPYLQYGHTPAYRRLGLDKAASTYGGALLVSRTFGPLFSLAGRGEYIKSTGNADEGSPNLLYGVGSKAFSFTLTPTVQRGSLFARADASITRVVDAADGAAFGKDGNRRSQARLLLEAGILF